MPPITNDWAHEQRPSIKNPLTGEKNTKSHIIGNYTKKLWMNITLS